MLSEVIFPFAFKNSSDSGGRVRIRLFFDWVISAGVSRLKAEIPAFHPDKKRGFQPEWHPSGITKKNFSQVIGPLFFLKFFPKSVGLVFGQEFAV
jgi:hypothetical protein